jgi:hypothetical protein
LFPGAGRSSEVDSPGRTLTQRSDQPIAAKHAPREIRKICHQFPPTLNAALPLLRR